MSKICRANAKVKKMPVETGNSLALGWRHFECNVTCNVMLVAKLVPRTADEPSAQRTASILRSLIDRTPFHRHRDECLCRKKSNSAHNICLSLIHTRIINNSTSFRFIAVLNSVNNIIGVGKLLARVHVSQVLSGC
jgi:hypothetical protein